MPRRPMKGECGGTPRVGKRGDLKPYRLGRRRLRRKSIRRR